MIEEVKNTVPWTYIVSDLKAKEIRTFCEKEPQKTNQQEYRIEKVITNITNISNGKVKIVHLIAGLIKTTLLNKYDFSCIINEPIFS